MGKKSLRQRVKDYEWAGMWNEALALAAEIGDLELCKRLVGLGADAIIFAVFGAAKRNHVHILEYLTQLDLPHWWANEALHCAARHGSHDACRYLIHNHDAWSVLQSFSIAYGNRDWETMKLMYDYGARTDIFSEKVHRWFYDEWKKRR